MPNTLSLVLIEISTPSGTLRYSWCLGDPVENLETLADFLKRCVSERKLTLALAAQPPINTADVT